MTDNPSSDAPVAERKTLTPAAERALAEAEARRKAAAASATPQAEGISGPEGSGTDPLWRLGAQRHRLGFLSARPCRATPTQALVRRLCPRHERTCPAIRRSRAPTAALVFGGPAVGVRGRRGRSDDAAGAAVGAVALATSADSQARTRRRDDPEAGRKSRCAPCRRRAPHHRRRHVRGAGSSRAGARADHAHPPARHRCAGTQGGLSAGTARWPRPPPLPCARCSATASVAISNIGPDKYAGRVVADVATRRTGNVSAALLASGHVRSYGGGHRNGWCANVDQSLPK